MLLVTLFLLKDLEISHDFLVHMYIFAELLKFTNSATRSNLKVSLVPE